MIRDDQPTPDGCGICGDAQHHHGQQYHPAVGGNHGWQKPTDAQRLERMQARRASREPRLLDCGWCYEENGEEVHPHPECPL